MWKNTEVKSKFEYLDKQLEKIFKRLDDYMNKIDSLQTLKLDIKTHEKNES